MSNEMRVCKHCNKHIIPHGKLWHEPGRLIFPQYCDSRLTKREYADLLHEPAKATQ